MKNGLYQGFDISQLQGENINFNQLKTNGTDFVIFRNYVGNDFKDQNCEKNIVAAKDAGLAVGIYNFLYPIQKLDPLSQAQLHWTNSNKSVVAHCADLEWPDSSAWGKAPYFDNGQEINDWTLKYLQEYKRISGLDNILYSFPFFIKSCKLSSDFKNYRLWIASYVANNPDVVLPWNQNDWIIWQTSGGTNAKLPNGSPVDTDVAKSLDCFGSVSIPAISVPIVPEINTQPTIIIPPVVATSPVEVAPAIEDNVSIAVSKINISKIIAILKNVAKWLLHINKFDF